MLHWRTEIIPADLRLLISPFNSKTINPYAYAGIGYMKWTVKDKPNQLFGVSPFPDVKEDGYDMYLPYRTWI